ncbi:MAG: sigma-70 family RNA polymerase sigma factor [Xanthomonadales bacterium]|nr:sigma-70 family RNA polymerase sigma factor [Xanthomonadales bacterium]
MSVLELQSELELIDRARQGSVDAFEQLVLHYQDRLYRFLLVRADNRADAEDVLQETFVAVFKYLPSYRPKYRFSTWLFTIAVRQLGRQRQSPGTADSLDSIACGLVGPEQLGIQIEQQRSMWQTARSCLGDAQFTALWLFYVEDMPLAEIGKVMKRPVSWVKVNLMRARRRLSKELQDYRFESAASSNEVTL